MASRRSFIKKTALGTVALTTTSMLPYTTMASESTFLKLPKISLAQWSLHRAFGEGRLNAVDFASIAKSSFGIDAVEYVNQFYSQYATDESFWNQMKLKADDAGVRSLLIMVDNEGDLGNPDATMRKRAVQNHFKWIHAAKILGCHSIRINAFGKGTREQLKSALVDGLGSLSAYGAKEGIRVLIENHGLHTSDADFMVAIIKEVNNSFLGTLPDFGNWCLNAEWGSTQNHRCTLLYDPFHGVSKFLPYANGVSAKSYKFNEAGAETIIDYPALLKLVKDSGYNGYIGIEYEGSELTEEAGILATKALIETVWATLD